MASMIYFLINVTGYTINSQVSGLTWGFCTSLWNRNRLHNSSHQAFSGVRIAQFLLFCSVLFRSLVSAIYSFWSPLCYLRTFLALLFFSFGYYIVCPSIYSFWLPLWYLQTFIVLLSRLAIVLSVPFQFTAFDCRCVIFMLFLYLYLYCCCVVYPVN